MPNVGRPSQDCHLCRSRRVKCDLGRPACQRCIKYGVECPGYRDQQELMFRNANPIAVKKRNKHAKKSKGSTTPLPLSSSASSSSFSTSLTPPALINDGGNVISSASTESVLHLAKPLNEHWSSHSVAIVLNVYSSMGFLEDTYKTYSPEGPLIWAAHLFARTYVTNLCFPTFIQSNSRQETQRDLGTFLGKTLSAVGTALKTPDGARRDDVLATVWILANYELLLGSLGQPLLTSAWHVHARGLYSILKTRGVKALYTESGRMAFWSTYNLIQVDCMASSTECPHESEEWFEVIRDNMQSIEILPLIVATFICKVSKFQSRMLTILRISDYAAASSEYVELVGGLVEAESEADLAFACIKEDLAQWDTYWRKMYCSALVKGHYIAHLFTNFLTHYPPCPISLDELKAQGNLCLLRLRDAAQEIIEFLPSTMGPLATSSVKPPKMIFDAMKMIWPLICVYTVPSTLPHQKNAVEMALMFIGKELGIRQALSIYPGDTAARVPPQAHAPLLGESELVDWVGRLR